MYMRLVDLYSPKIVAYKYMHNHKHTLYKRKKKQFNLATDNTD